jgi:peptidoglycan/LPS O-acetylase OafA/YrhL
LTKVNNNKHIHSLTSIRGIAALWVVAYHFWNDIVLLFPVCEFLTPLMQVGNYAVPFFFILSGFVLTYNYAHTFVDLNWHKYFKFISLRLAHIYPVHIVTLVFVLCMITVARFKGISITDSGYTFDTFIQNVLLIHTWVPNFTLNWNYPAWAVSSEWFAYLWFPIVSVLMVNHLKSLTTVIILLSLTWLGSIAIYAMGNINFKELIVIIPTFLTGMLLHNLWIHLRQSYHPSVFMPDISLIAIILIPFLCSGIVLISTYISLFVVLILSLAFLQDSCRQYWQSPPLIALGKASYSLYMSHTLAQKLCYGFIPPQRFVESGIFVKGGIVGLYLGAIALFCIITYFLIEKPSRKYFRQVSEKLV